jgi:hypothetical protein
MEPIVLPSGAELQITLLPYEEAWNVSQRVAKVLEGIDLKNTDIDLKKFMLSDVSKIQGPLLQIMSSRELVEAAKVCFKRCTVNGMKIDGKTFDEPNMRQDYLPTVFHVLKENIAPFFAGLISSLGTS